MSDIDPMAPDGSPAIKQDVGVLEFSLPVVEAQQHTAPLYTNGHSDVGPETERVEQQSQSYDHEQQHQHQLRDHEDHEDQAQKSLSPHLQIEASAITSAEELRIAAQLSQDLSQDFSHGITSMLDEPNHHQNNDYSLRNGATEHGESDDAHLQPNIGQHHPQHPQHPQHPEQDERLAGDVKHHTSHVEEPLSFPTDEPSAKHTEGALPPSHEQPSQSPFLSDEQKSLEQQSLGHQAQYLPEQQQEQQQQQHNEMQQQVIPDQQSPLQPLPTQQPQPLQQTRPPVIQPHNSIDQLAHSYATHAYHPVQEHIPPRKRSKVSRACDECRRKKVKCDASSETGEDPCSNCRRSSTHCLFSRIPQKRGPSKGYIKELADRIHHIEGKLANEGNLDGLAEALGSGRRESGDIFSPSTQHDEASRKRAYSSISGGEFNTPTSSRPGNWSSESRPNQLHQAPSSGVKSSTSSWAHGLAPQPLGRLDIDAPPRTVVPLNGMPADLDQAAFPKELIEDAFHVYLSIIHPYFPFLAGTKGHLEAQLTRCPPLLQAAFVEAFYGTMQSCVSAPGLFTNGDISSATRIVATWESDPSPPRDHLTNLVHLQALILMAIATDNYGISSLKGEHGGPPKASILGRAVGLAYSMRLHMASCNADPDAEQNGESDESIAIRTWWTLVMMDRWNALSTASPLFIPNDSVVILPGLISVLGENVYHLIRLSNILGHFAPVSLTPPQVLLPGSGALPILNSFFNLAIELFREVLPADMTPSTHPILNLVYWHSRLLSYLFQTNSRSQDVIWACKESVALLLNNTTLLSPLNHHFFSLSTLALVELAKLDKTREEATLLLKDLWTRNLAPSTWDGVIREYISRQLQYMNGQVTPGQLSQPGPENMATTTSKAEETMGPENGNGNGNGNDNGNGSGAEAVSLRTSTTYAHLGFDPRPILRTGYLNILAEGPLSGDQQLG